VADFNINGVWGVAISGSYAYMAGNSGTNGLRIFDISDPTTPIQVGAQAITNGYTDKVAVMGHYALLTSPDAGLQVIDVADPVSPQLVGNFMTASAAWDVAVSGNLAYVAVRDAGVQVIDLTDPTHPLPYVKLDTDGDAVAVAIAGDLIYVADASKGLKTLRLPGPDLVYQRNGNNIALSWPASATGFVLQSATTLANGGDWQDSSLTPTEANGQKIVTITPTEPRSFFRLRGP
jgi:hypothetical protein